MFDHPVILLSIFTLVAVLGIGAWQWRSVRASQARHGEKPGDVTMVKHERTSDEPEASVHPEPSNRPTPAGDVTSFKQQDAEADTTAGTTPAKPGALWGGKPRQAA